MKCTKRALNRTAHDHCIRSGSQTNLSGRVGEIVVQHLKVGQQFQAVDAVDDFQRTNARLGVDAVLVN